MGENAMSEPLAVLTIDEDGEWRVNPGGEKNAMTWAGMPDPTDDLPMLTYALLPVAAGVTVTASLEWMCRGERGLSGELGTTWDDPVWGGERPCDRHMGKGCGWVTVVREV